MTERPDSLPRTFRGDARRERPLMEAGPILPWAAIVKVVPLQLARGVTFEVYVEWTGPPAAGFPPDPAPGLRSDTYVTADASLAKSIAGAAERDLRASQVPDLRAHAVAIRERLARGAYG